MFKYLLLVFLLISSYANAQTPSGWDFNLTKRCAITNGILGSYNYQDRTQCPNVDWPSWTLTVESEDSPGDSCPGPVNESFLINGSNSPVQLSWIQNSYNWTVGMVVDTYHNLPCWGNFFTFFAFGDRVYTVLPSKDHLTAFHLISYFEWTPNSDQAARLIVGTQLQWDGVCHILEINLASQNWGNDPLSPTVYVNHAFNSCEYVVINGQYYGLSVPDNGTLVQAGIDWKYFIAEAIRNGWFTTPRNPSVTQSVYIGCEVKGMATCYLWHTNFDIVSQ